MATCKECGKRFNITEVEDELECELGGLYLEPEFNGLCYNCAIEKFESHDYYENCEKCGKRFHVCDDDEQFEEECGEYGLIDASRSYMSNLILCAECALDKARIQYEEYQKEHPDYFEDDDNGISVYEAAEIWASSGKDEDNMFGYSREELEDAL